MSDENEIQTEEAAKEESVENKRVVICAAQTPETKAIYLIDEPKAVDRGCGVRDNKQGWQKPGKRRIGKRR